MYKIEYSALNYFHSPVSDECLCIGVLFHNATTGQRFFKYISNFQRFHSFDDEADVEFVKLYLKGIKNDVEPSLFNYKKEFSIKEYVRVFANDFKFSSVRTLDVEENEDYITNISKIYLKYDFARSQRLNSFEEKKLIKRMFESNCINYTTAKTCGPFKDEITFDYRVGDICIKLFSFKGKNLKRVIGNARQWSFIADEMSQNNQILYIYDTDYEDTDNLEIILNILNRHATVLEIDKGMDFILKHCS